jgi:hypothetical protein
VLNIDGGVMAELWSKQTVEGYQSGYGSTRIGNDINGNTFNNSIPLNLVTNSYISSASGSKNPRWKDQVKLGQNATTGFIGSKYSVSNSTWVSGQQNLVYQDAITKRIGTSVAQGFGYANVFPPPLGNPSNIAASVDNRAKRKFLDRYESIKSSIEAGQDFGEYKETLESVHHPLNSLKQGMIHYLEKLKKVSRFRKSPVALKKILTDTYLEFHFGWQPLADDVANLIADAGRFRFPQYPCQGQHQDRYSGTTETRSFAIAFLPSVFHRYKTTDSYYVRYKGMVRSRAASGQISIGQALRLTPENWLPTAWDLLPYSWIADYFVNIGDILQGLSFINADLVWGCKTTRTESVNEFANLIYQDPPPVSDGFTNYLVNARSISGGNAVLGVKSIVRSSFDGDDLVPTLEFKVPTSKYPFLNMGALLIQRSKSIVPFFT